MPKPLSRSEQLIAELVANGGQLAVDEPDRAKYEARVSAANRFHKVPAGKQLVVEGHRWSKQYVIRLQDAPEWLNAPLEPIPVPKTLRSPHPVVTSLAEADSVLSLERTVKHRALLFIQALVIEAQRRGYKIEAIKVIRDVYGSRRPTTKDHFSVVINRHSFGIEVKQEVKRIPHEPSATELARAARESWYRIPKFDALLCERLAFSVSPGHEHRQSKWSDSKSHPLDDYLAEILQEIELRAGAAERSRLAAIEAAVERRKRWEIAMQKAKKDYREAQRGQFLSRQADDWHQARRVRDYLEEMRSVIKTMADPEDAAAATTWFDWAHRRVSDLDPLLGHLAMPEDREPTGEELKPFLKGLSPYGPA